MTRLIVGDASGKIVERLESLRREAAAHKTVRGRQFEEALGALQDALQEVEAVEEALSRQNDDLIATREQLEIERHRYRDLFEQAPDGYLVTDVMGTIDEANRAASRLLNHSPTALRGKPLAVFLNLEQRADFRSLLRDLQPGAKRKEVELILQPSGAPARTVMVSLTRDEDRPGRPARLLWILRDVSERKATEEALRETEERLRHAQRL
ncbi:MAG TPA: PAS domain-containing protein, partial [Thermoanaerobaculia bacterium]|nr:PAS domain-containing protein [Thermoanaerobaculia bacterium]